MDAHFTTNDHKYTMLLARKKEKIARKKKQKAVERAPKKAHITETLNATQIVFNSVVIEKMNVRTLDAQLDKLKALGVPDIKPKSQCGVQAVKLQSLMTTLASYFNMLLQTPVEPISPQNLEDTTDTHGDELIESYGEEDDMDSDDEYTTSMEISPVTLDLPECSPNLMPFHISHSGPAPISTYFRVKPSTPSSPHLSLTQNTSNETHLSTDNSQNTLVSKDSQFSLTIIAESQSALLEEDSQACPAGVSALIADADSGTQASPSSELARAPPAAPPVEHSLSNNFIAAFRGRQVHGRTVDLPQGYGGIVLSAPSSDANSQGDDIATAETIAQTRRKSRATRTCSRQMETDEDDAVDDDSRVEIRRLTPVSRFSSLTVWSPDVPVDEGKDECLRSLTEWTKLAAEIHAYDA
ncbi:ribonuclease H2 non-catalytic subunit-domain-containing protein [Suillus subaureus]|uniref:Ribonuclease H2 non-catalytic subunit-domain-containing protein n=1 Tax=Suillus subaureus TaxID=48587 RepID=A0A9P7DZH0_9AGAM|nr:ribonuclease H2 non-catalytic subunit-domain-containing protein [Suillus subaureus]KAG1807010.1 ribonuclease H2 non-catalytic subunit-domain-containing protein [Suillus subaureus]